jgi:aminoglycoside phosphotransferase (APT) family kinase protein
MRAAASAAEVLTPEWLSHALGRPVSECRVEPLRGQGVSGVLSRVHLDDGSTLIAKQGHSDPVSRSRQRAFGMYNRELAFYRDIAARVPVRTPECFYVAPDDEAPVLLLMEDLAPAVAASFTVGLSASEAADAVDAMAAMHAAWWGSADLDALGLWRSTPEDASRWAGDLEERLPRFLDRFGSRLSLAEVKLAELVTEHLARCIVETAALPSTLAHGDPGCPNLMFGHPSAAIAIIDWQLVAARNGLLDLAWLVILGVPVGLRRQMERAWLERYNATLGIDSADAERWYGLGAVLALRAPIWMGGESARRSAYTDAYAEATLARAFSAGCDLNLASLLVNE